MAPLARRILWVWDANTRVFHAYATDTSAIWLSLCSGATTRGQGETKTPGAPSCEKCKALIEVPPAGFAPAVDRFSPEYPELGIIWDDGERFVVFRDDPTRVVGFLGSYGCRGESRERRFMEGLEVGLDLAKRRAADLEHETRSEGEPSKA